MRHHCLREVDVVVGDDDCADHRAERVTDGEHPGANRGRVYAACTSHKEGAMTKPIAAVTDPPIDPMLIRLALSLLKTPRSLQILREEMRK